MPRSDLFEFRAYDKTHAWLGPIADPFALGGSVVGNAVGTLQLSLQSTDPMLQDLLEDGARVAVYYRGQRLSTAMVRQGAGKLIPGGQVVLPLEDDWRIIRNTLAWPRPDKALTASGTTDPGQSTQVGAQGADGTVDGRDGHYRWSATTYEGAIKEVIQKNLSRLGRPINVLPDQGRGGNFPQSAWPVIRMSTLAEAVQPLLDASGLRLDVWASGGKYQIEVVQPDPWSAPLTLESGVVADGDWTIGAPPVTRFVFGGPGEDAARVFWSAADTALEAQYGDIIELFKDATGGNLNWPDGLSDDLRNAIYYLIRGDVAQADKNQFITYQNQSANDAMKDAIPAAGVNATLAESEGFHFFGSDGIQLLSPVTVRAAGLQDFPDRIASADFSWSNSGLTVKPAIGNAPSDPYARLAAKLVAVADAQRRISRNR